MTLLDSLSTTNWVPIGPSPIDAPGVGLGFAAGRIEAVAADPGNGNVMYVAGNNGGVWKTYDWDSDIPTWLPLGDAEGSLNFAGYHPLVVHPANHDLILAAVSGHGAGVLKSMNGGVSWQLLGDGLFEGASMGSLAVHPTDTNILYVSVWSGGPGGGVYRSTDAGLNWSNTTSLHLGPVTDVIVGRYDSQTLYAGLVGAAPSGVYKSTDGGENWTATTGLPSGLNLGAAIRLDSASTPSVVYVSYLVGLGANAVVERVKTTDGGQTWTPLAPTPGTPEWRSWHLVLGVDPGNDQHIFVNDAYQLFESKDGGQTWTRVDKQANKWIGDDWVNIGFDSSGITMVTADRNIYRYAPKQKTWKSKQGTLQVTQFYDITPDPFDSGDAYGVSQDHPLALRFSGTSEWAYLPAGGETGRVLIDPSDTSRLYVSNPLDPTKFVARSTDSGQTWKTIFQANDFAASDYAFAYSTQRAFAIDASNPSRLLIGTTRVWETANAAAANPTWKAISDVLGGAATSQQYITALAIAPSNPKAIYASTADGHVWVTANGGTGWTQRDAGLFGSGAGKIIDIRIDPSNPWRVFAVGSGQGSVWYLHKVGKPMLWKNISGDLPTYLRASAIFADWKSSTPALYLGTTRGVYHSLDLGGTWNVFGVDMPNTNVTDIESPLLDVLYAATFGRGAWAILIGRSRIIGKVISQVFGPGVVHPGDPVEGVTVVLEPGGAAGNGVLTTVTNRRGRYVFVKVPPGAYSIRPIPPPGYELVGRARQVATHGSDIRDMNFRLIFDDNLARDAEPYLYTANLTELPGREARYPVGTEDEFVRR